MRNWMGIVVALTGCDALADQQSEGVALATLHGTLSLGREVEPPASNLRVSVLWRDPTLGSLHDPGVIPLGNHRDSADAPAPCADGQPTGWRLETSLLEQTVRVDTVFPSGFSVRLTEPPPTAALFAHPDGGGISSAHGDLVVYEDRNGNDRLDPSTFDTRSPDLIFGSSQGATPWGVGQRKHYTIVYLTHDSANADGDAKAGYSIVTEAYDGFASSTFSAQRLSDAMIDLTLDPTTYAQQMACTVMCKVERPDFPEDTNVYFAGDAGENLPSDLEAGASIWSKQDGDTSTLTLARCVKQQPSSTGNFTRHTLDLSIISAQGCTETTSFQSVVTVAGPSAELGLPCMQYREDNTMYPVDPP